MLWNDWAELMTVFTIGHSTRPIEAFIALLEGAQIDRVVDARRFPGQQ